MYSNRLSRLEARRIDESILTAKRANEVYLSISQSDAVKYAVGAMQPIDPEYTKNTFVQGDRVKNQLAKHLSSSHTFRYQGSTTNDTHIRAKSDIDLLVICTKFFWLEKPQVPAFPYEGDSKADMRDLRSESIACLRDSFPKVNVDDSGSKAVALEGGSLTRKIDVVPASWEDTNMYSQTKDEVWRGVKIFNKDSGLFIGNLPFLFNQRVQEKDDRTLGGMRRAARLMKSLKYDSDREMMSSYDITSIAYNIPDRELMHRRPFELRIVDACRSYCHTLRDDEFVRNNVTVPNGTRLIFDPTEGATLDQLDNLIAEIDQLSKDIVQENYRSFTRLAEARVEYPMMLQTR